MPFVTEYNTSLIFKRLLGEIPEDIREWEPYKKSIYFLNRLDKTNLLYFKKFCENPIQNIDSIYTAVKVTDNKEFVFEGGNPSYHKVENCDRLTSDFVNYRIPGSIKEKGDEAINEFRLWFKENHSLFSQKQDVYQMHLHAKYGIQTLEKVDYKNSGNVYKENLTADEIERRIDSLLHNASVYYKEDDKRQNAIRAYQKSTFLAFEDQEIEKNDFGYTDDELKAILKEYFFLFIQPTLFYLKEFFKAFFNSNIEIHEKIFEQLNFKKCSYCYAENYDDKSQKIAEKKKILLEKFGDYEFPIEPTQFHFKEVSEFERIAFIYCRVFRCSTVSYLTDGEGNYKIYKAEFINHKNRFIYCDTKIYEQDITQITLFRKYITKIQQDIKTRVATYTTYPYEI